MPKNSTTVLRTSFAVLTAAAASLALSSCGPDAEEGVSKQLAGQAACELISADGLEQAAGMSFDKGQPEGQQCSFSASEGPLPMVTVGAGMSATGAAGGQAAGGAVLNTEVEDTEVDGVPAKQASTQPRGSMCAVDVLLAPDDVSQVFSVSYSGPPANGQDSCEVAKKIASTILAKLPE